MEDLIRQHLEQGRTREAFDLIASSFQDRIYRLAVAIVGNRTLAEDAAQEALLRIWKGLPGFRGGSTLSTWIYAIARNASLTVLAGSRSRAATSMEEPAVLAAAEGHGRPGAPARAGFDVEAMVGQLRPQYSHVLRLYYMQERSYEEVAQMLDLPMGTVKTLLHRAKLELAAQLTAASVRKV
jgi:RNA polymerase sigma-70 factor (ECF subfamily)